MFRGLVLSAERGRGPRTICSITEAIRVVCASGDGPGGRGHGEKGGSGVVLKAESRARDFAIPDVEWIRGQ